MVQSQEQKLKFKGMIGNVGCFIEAAGLVQELWCMDSKVKSPTWWQQEKVLPCDTFKLQVFLRLRKQLKASAWASAARARVFHMDSLLQVCVSMSWFSAQPLRRLVTGWMMASSWPAMNLSRRTFSNVSFNKWCQRKCWMLTWCLRRMDFGTGRDTATSSNMKMTCTP